MIAIDGQWVELLLHAAAAAVAAAALLPSYTQYV
jgi:hypothetical protein